MWVFCSHPENDQPSSIWVNETRCQPFECVGHHQEPGPKSKNLLTSKWNGFTLQGTNISHLGKRKIMDSRVPAGRGYVSSLEGTTVDLSTWYSHLSKRSFTLVPCLFFHLWDDFSYKIFPQISGRKSTKFNVWKNKYDQICIYKNTQPLANLLTFVAYIFSRIFFTIFYFMVPTGWVSYPQFILAA